MARSKKGEAAQRAAFLQALSETASITKACEISKLPRRTVYNWREADPHFAEAWDEALELGTDALEDEAIRRALHGTDKPVYQGGKRVGAVREFSDTLLIFMLKAKRPEKYKERTESQVTVTHRFEEMPDDELDREIIALAGETRQIAKH